MQKALLQGLSCLVWSCLEMHLLPLETDMVYTEHIMLERMNTECNKIRCTSTVIHFHYKAT